MTGVELLAPQRLWWWLVVAAMAIAYLLLQRRRVRNVVRFTSIDLLESVAPTRPGWRRHLVAGLQLTALAIGVFALARPVEREMDVSSAAGRIVITFDVSLSMQATDVAPSRLDAAKEAALDFVEQVDPRVEIGLVSFSGQVRQVVAPTLDRGRVEQGIDGLELGEGTAIGDALIAAVGELVQDVGDGTEEAVGSIVLLSDGETTMGTETADGAAAAAEAGVPVYAIAFGTDGGSVIDPASGEIIPVPVNTSELRMVAETTEGQFYEAPTADALADAYDQISDDLRETLGEPEEVILEQTWRYVALALVVFAIGWLLGLWWLRGLV
jgi:Ca-activated chloride channel family protein